MSAVVGVEVLRRHGFQENVKFFKGRETCKRPLTVLLCLVVCPMDPSCNDHWQMLPHTHVEPLCVCSVITSLTPFCVCVCVEGVLSIHPYTASEYVNVSMHGCPYTICINCCIGHNSACMCWSSSGWWWWLQLHVVGNNMNNVWTLWLPWDGV